MYTISQLPQLVLSGQHRKEILTILLLLLVWAAPGMYTPVKGVKGGGFKPISILYSFLILGVIISFCLYFDVPVGYFGFSSSIALLIGLILFGSLHFMGLRNLGPFWKDAADPKADGHLVTTGIYRFIRHPIYSMFFFQGLILATLSPASLLLGIGFMWIPIYRLLIKKEEQLLIAKYGDSYLSYMKQTPYRIVPFIY